MIMNCFLGLMIVTCLYELAEGTACKEYNDKLNISTEHLVEFQANENGTKSVQLLLHVFLSHLDFEKPDGFWIKLQGRHNKTYSHRKNKTVTDPDVSLINCDDALNGNLCHFYIEQGFTAIQATTERVVFEVQFGQEFTFFTATYRRNCTGNTQTRIVKAQYNCIGMLMDSFLSYFEAATICLNLCITDRLVHNVTLKTTEIDMQRRTSLVELSWISPIHTHGLVKFIVVESLHSFLSKSKAVSYALYGEPADPTNETPIFQVMFDKSHPLFLGKHVAYKHNISTSGMLIREEKYLLVIRAVYNDYQCAEGECIVTVVEWKPDVHCEPQFKYCSKNANCEKLTSQISTGCVCQSGYEGSGINTNKTMGTEIPIGCTDINSCSMERNPCDESAYCTDRKAPHVGANCTCRFLFTGEGLKDGNGCTFFIVPFSVSVGSLLFILFAALIGYKLYKHKTATAARKKALRSTTTQAPNNKDHCIPTFGDRWEIARGTISLVRQLGHGNHGTVYEGYMSENTETKVAVKMLNEMFRNDEGRRAFLSEISFMINVGHHDNIVKVIGCCTTTRPLMLVTEYLKHGDLLTYLSERVQDYDLFPDNFKYEVFYKMSLDVAKGLRYLSKIKIIHGDVAARNILVGDHQVCKISDFGLANDVYRYGVIRSQTEKCIPFRWASPERLMGGKVSISTKSDVWSYGNLMYEIVTFGCPPYPDLDFDVLLEHLEAGHRMSQPPTCSCLMYSLMMKCWSFKRCSRPTFSEIVKELEQELFRNKESILHNYVNLIETRSVLKNPVPNI